MTKAKFIPNFKFPYHLVKPIGIFLMDQANKLKRRKKAISRDDPFNRIDRGEDKASPDTEVIDRVRHESLSAIREQLDRRLVQIRKAITRIKIGKYGICERCSRMIDTDRLMVFPEATFCVHCEQYHESKKTATPKNSFKSNRNIGR
jgi:RNA polymerase-binding transcription factor DksA